MKRKSNATEKNLCSTSPELQLEIVDENLTRTTNTEPVPSSSSSIAAPHEHKETYVNVMYNNNTGVISPGTVESPIEDDDDAEMMKSRTKKSSRAPFRFKKFSLMKSGSFKLKQMSPQPTELTSSPVEEKTATFERQKSTSSSTRSSQLKKLFMLSRADPAKRGQKDVSLRNLRHVL
jgi:hypothetical protein